MTNAVIPSPSKPWESSLEDKRRTFFLLVLSLLVSSVLVKFWVFNGKLGFAIAFFISSQIIFVSNSYRN